MEEKQILTTLNKKVIKNIIFKYPELIALNAEQLVRDEYNNILNIREELHKYRNKVIELEKELESKEKKFRNMQEWFDIEFETETTEYVTRKSNLVLNGNLVYHYNP